MEFQGRGNPEKKRNVTSFDLGDLKGLWDAYCKSNGVGSGEALCQIIAKLTNAEPTKIPRVPRQKNADVTRPEKFFSTKESVEKKRQRLYLSLTQSELRAVEARTKADGFSKPTAWAVALIRTRLTDQPQFGTTEIEVLGESNHQLLAIGKNLNQIAHALNATKGKSVDQYDSELVAALADAVKKHVKKVGDALRASIYRWTLE